jgi:hypothetical protein
MSVCTTNYVCVRKWYTAADLDVIAYAAGAHAEDLNIICVTKGGDIQFQVQDDLGQWFTPTESSYTVISSNLVRLPRANMPDIRIVASADAVFSVEGSLR